MRLPLSPKIWKTSRSHGLTYKAGPNLPLSFEWSGEAEM